MKPNSIKMQSALCGLMTGMLLLAGGMVEAEAQTTFGPQQIINPNLTGARNVIAADLDGDGDPDVLASDYGFFKLAWYENEGTATFGPEQILNAGGAAVGFFFAADLDGDGDQDVIADSGGGGSIHWFKNDGTGTFGPQQLVTNDMNGAESVFAVDIDGDGDLDVLGAARDYDRIAWFENTDGLGTFTFGQTNVISDNADNAIRVFAADLDGDGDPDVLSASRNDNKIAWYENDGAGTFGPQQIISTNHLTPDGLYAADLDGDGDQDVIATSLGDRKLAWYENDGAGAFGPQQIIAVDCCVSARGVVAADLDGDGDQDVLNGRNGKIVWYENDGIGAFGLEQIITPVGEGALNVFASDLDGDGDLDVLGADNGSGVLSWYENLSVGIPPTADAGPNQSIHAGDFVQLDGSGSSDDNTATEDLVYAWSFAQKPGGSTTALSDVTIINPTFTPDLPGDYAINLTVTDEGELDSAPSTVMVTSNNAPPNANAGPGQGTYVSNTVLLDGSSSSDPDDDALTYAWTLTDIPVGSAAALTGANSQSPSFTLDLVGSYEATLIVNDGFVDSTGDTVVITAVSTGDFSANQTNDTRNILSALPPGSVTSSGNLNALDGKLVNALKALSKGNVDKAISDLTNAIEETDGCALRATPDVVNGPGNSWGKDTINNCVDQNGIYPLLKNALDALTI